MEVLLNGYTVDFDACVSVMDDEIRETLHGEMAPCEEQAFLDKYCEMHFCKYGENFEI